MALLTDAGLKPVRPAGGYFIVADVSQIGEEQTDRQIDRQTDGQTDGRMDGRTDGQRDRETDTHTCKYRNRYFFVFPSILH